MTGRNDRHLDERGDLDPSEYRKPHRGSDRSLGGTAAQMAEHAAPNGRLERGLSGGENVPPLPTCSPAGTPDAKGWRRASECRRMTAGRKCAECVRAERELADEERIYGPAAEEWER